jgi:fibronectin type 3 domain-containing protein
VALSPNQVTVTWSPSTDNVAVAGYQIQRIQGLTRTTIGTTSNIQFTDTTALPGTLYFYGVISVDAAGNQSYMAAVAQVLTPKQ